MNKKLSIIIAISVITLLLTIFALSKVSNNNLLGVDSVVNNNTELQYKSVNVVGINSASTTVVKSGSGFLHSITILTPIASDSITLYDSTTASGTKLGTKAFPATLTDDGETFILDTLFQNGLTINVSSTVGTVNGSNLNVSFR